MFESFIITGRNFNFSDIEIEHITDQNWSVDTDYEEEVQKCWEERVRQAGQNNMHIWDGLYYRVTNLDELSQSKEKIKMKLNTISYRYIATLENLKDLFIEKSYEAPRHLSTAALIRTTDGAYLFGKRTHGGSIDLIGGGAQPNEIEIILGADLERNLLKEMEEEAGIEISHIKNMQGIGILHSTTSNIVTISLVQLSLSKTETEEIFKTRTDNEMSELI